MAMLGYFDIFPERMRTELRTAAFENGNADDPLPGGTFIFTEYFCADITLAKVCHCECRCRS